MELDEDLPIDHDSFPLYMIVDQDQSQRNSFLLKTPNWCYTLLFDDLERAKKVILHYGIQGQFAVGIVQNPVELLLWMKSAQEGGGNKVFFNPQLIDVPGDPIKRLEPDVRGTLEDLLQIASELVAELYDTN